MHREPRSRIIENTMVISDYELRDMMEGYENKIKEKLENKRAIRDYTVDGDKLIINHRVCKFINAAFDKAGDIVITAIVDTSEKSDRVYNVYAFSSGTKLTKYNCDESNYYFSVADEERMWHIFIK